MNEMIDDKNMKLPEGWKTRKLGELCDIIGGGTPSKKNAKFYEGDIYWATVRDMKSETISDTEFKISEEAVKRSSTNIIPEGNVIIATRVGLGKVCKNENDTAINQDLRGIIPRKKTELTVDYLFYWFKSISSLIVAEGRGATVQGVTLPFVKSLKISFPPLHEQQHIVSILDTVFEAIDEAKENARENLKYTEGLFDSYLQGVFEKKGEGWDERLFEDCFRLRSGDNLTSRNMSKGKYPVLGGNGIAGYHNKFNLSGSNVIIGRVGALCGNVRHIIESVWLTDNAFKVVDFKIEFDHSYLTYLLNHKNLRNYARQAAQPVISNSSLKDVVLNFPKSVSDQQTIVQKLDSLSAETKKLESIYNQKLNNLEELKKAILQKAFRGELKTEELQAI